MKGAEEIIRIVPCPKCRKPAEYSQKNLFRPFCSRRCKSEDIIAWTTGDYIVPGQAIETDDDLSYSASAEDGTESEDRDY
jgi:endogenous inhibitor of DNA gyrase (YacG/DUF329 family)